jgi:hypothetical protein
MYNTTSYVYMPVLLHHGFLHPAAMTSPMQNILMNDCIEILSSSQLRLAPPSGHLEQNRVWTSYSTRRLSPLITSARRYDLLVAQNPRFISIDSRDPLRPGRRLVIVSKTVLDAFRWIVLAKRMQCKRENINGGEAASSHWLASSEMLESRDTSSAESTIRACCCSHMYLPGWVCRPCFVNKIKFMFCTVR